MEIYASVYDLDRHNAAVMAMLVLFVASFIASANGSVLVFLGRTGTKHRLLQVCAGISVLLFATGFGIAIYIVHNARQALLDSYLTDKGHLWYETINTVEPVLSVVGSATGLFSALGALTFVLLARRSVEFRARMPIALFSTCFLLFFVTALGISLRLSPIGNAPPITALMEPEVVWAVKHGDDVLTITRSFVLAIATLGTFAILIQAFRRRTTTDHFYGPTLILGILIAGLGTHAWLRTRPLAFDARNPFPRPREGPVALCPYTSLDFAKLPCATINDAQCSQHDFWERRLGLVEIGPTGAKLNGEFVKAPEQLGQMVRNRFESQSTFHYRHVIVAAEATIPAAEFSPWLAPMPPPILVTRLLGFDEPARQPTYTAGLVPRRQRCACRPIERPSPQTPPPSAPSQ